MKFKSVADFQAYARKRKVRPNTIINIAGQDHMAADFIRR